MDTRLSHLPRGSLKKKSTVTLFLEQIPSDIKVTTLSFYKRFVIQNSNAYLPVLANNYPIQEAMESFVFPNEISDKIDKNDQICFKHFLCPLNLCKSAASCMDFH